ncbi:hypothetical protein [Microbacterium resistens]|uniref:hypothetical protein n=1 Tax=Microbacterium resistens TaxID=156977 RepID=UPI00366F3EF1
MHDDDLRSYVEEILHQQQLVGLAVQQLNAALGANQISHVECFAAAQAILTGAAQISKLLWADTQRDWTPERIAFARDRAAAIRAIAEPGKDSVLERRSVRNSIEHYDARIDDLKLRHGVRAVGEPRQTWTPDDKPTQHRGVVDIGIFDKSQLPIPIPPENVTWVRHIDPVTMEYTALDQSVSLQAVVDAVVGVAARASEWLAARPIPTYTPGDFGDLSDVGL